MYEEVPGWKESTLGVTDFDKLPAEAKHYIRIVEEAIGAPVDIVSTGPNRHETIVLRSPFDT